MLAGHPLRSAFLYRARLDAVRRQADVDGKRIDPWHLAALLEGLRLRMDPDLSILERGEIFDAARHAFDLYQWLVAPDFDQEGEVHQAQKALNAPGPNVTPLLAAAASMHVWLGEGGARAPMRAALVRFWTREKLLRTPVPLTGAAALRAESQPDRAGWTATFLAALAGEADDYRQLLKDLERAWFAARAAVAGRRRHSRAAAAVDILAATPLISATSLAAGLGMAVKNAAALLDAFRAAGIAVEVSHRARRRLFGLQGQAPLRDSVSPPRRPVPGRGRGRPPSIPFQESVADSPPPQLPLLSPIERRAFDYSDLEHWMAHLDQTVRQARRTLQTLVSPMQAPGARGPDGAPSTAVVDVPDAGPGEDPAEHHVWNEG
ncbi:MAG TPA: hypothetical protein VME92_22030 [Acetobacteraceae bacterium]|nr:hypothetical protein [Acetobacteraceae bacterium]